MLRPSTAASRLGGGSGGRGQPDGAVTECQNYCQHSITACFFDVQARVDDDCWWEGHQPMFAVVACPTTSYC